MPNLTKWQWRTGLIFAIVFGFLNAGVGGLTGNWKTFVSVLCTSLLTQITSYLTKSPIDEVADDSVKTYNNNQPTKTP